MLNHDSFKAHVVAQVMVAFGIVTALQVFGINIQPFLAVGGVSGLVIGLAAQSVVANLISGINLVSKRVKQVQTQTETWLNNEPQ